MEAVGKGFEQARKKHRGVGDELLRDVEEIITLVERCRSSLGVLCACVCVCWKGARDLIPSSAPSPANTEAMDTSAESGAGTLWYVCVCVCVRV